MNLCSPILRCTLLALAGAAALDASAADSLRIEQVYSNLDGTVQYIQLRDSGPQPGTRDLGGLVITSTRNGIARSVTIPAGTRIEGGPGVPFLVTTFQMPWVCCTGPYGPPAPYSDQASGTRVFGPDSRQLPARFLPLRGGRVSLSNGDTVTYGQLPTAGHLAVDRAGAVVRARAESYLLHTLPIPSVPRLTEVVPGEVSLREYRSRDTGRYMRTADADEIHALDTNRIPGWTRVPYAGFRVRTFAGQVDFALASPQTVFFDASPVCRYLLPPPVGAHVFGVSADECAALAAANPGAVLESAAAFHALPPDPATGACDEDGPAPYPVHRLVDALGGGGQRLVAAWTTLDDGWAPAGAGPDGVVFCVSGYDDPLDEVLPAPPAPTNPALPRMPPRGG